MADISDVEDAIAAVVLSTLYPGGSTQSSLLGTHCRIYRGWPNSPALNADLAAGTINVTVATDNDSGKTTTRYLPAWQTVPRVPGTAIHCAGDKVSISGYPRSGDLVGVQIDGTPFVYRVKQADMPEQIAANLTQAISSSRFAALQGRDIEVPGASVMLVRAVCDAQCAFESRRQEKDVRIICWCPDPIMRDLTASALDSALSHIAFLPLTDGTNGRVVYRNTQSYDQAQNALLYRRDLVYTVEYPTMTILQQPSMLFGVSGVNGNAMIG